MKLNVQARENEKWFCSYLPEGQVYLVAKRFKPIFVHQINNIEPHV